MLQSEMASLVREEKKVAPCDKWTTERDKDLSTSIWLECERCKDDRATVECLDTKFVCGSPRKFLRPTISRSPSSLGREI